MKIISVFSHGNNFTLEINSSNRYLSCCYFTAVFFCAFLVVPQFYEAQEQSHEYILGFPSNIVAKETSSLIQLVCINQCLLMLSTNQVKMKKILISFIIDLLQDPLPLQTSHKLEGHVHAGLMPNRHSIDSFYTFFHRLTLIFNIINLTQVLYSACTWSKW